MSQDIPNPFALPGMTAAFMNTPNNPLITSMDMMRQAMGNMGYAPKPGSDEAMVNPMAPEELEKRIGELRVVENWLKLNLSMLSSTIQGMEVQLATVKTLQSFVAMGQSSGAASATDASPLEIALGLKPAQGKSTAPQKPGGDPTAAAPANPAVGSAANTQPGSGASPQNAQQAAAQGWWNMLESQFSQIAAATANAAKMGSEALQQSATQGSTNAAAKKATASKPRASKKSAKATRTPKKQA